MFIETEFKRIEIEWGVWDTCPVCDLKVTATVTEKDGVVIKSATAYVYDPETDEPFEVVPLNLPGDWVQFNHLEEQIEAESREIETNWEDHFYNLHGDR